MLPEHMADSKEITKWLRDMSRGHMEMLSKMQRALAKEFKEEHLEQPEPDRAWCRVYRLYQDGLHFLITEQREQAKLTMLAKRAGMSSLTDDEYSTELVELGREAVRELSDEEIDAELRRRGRLALADGVS